ncbi:MAG: ATPase [Clostridia bacterium]|nr:ATPase [Clostridia bacterium]
MNLKETAIGIEFGSTRIKAVLTGKAGEVLASGSYTWENQFINGIWTYSERDIITGLKACYADLKADVRKKHGITLTETGAIGISAMMHGYIALDREGKLLVPFRTWRNNLAEDAAEKLTELFSFHIPARWSIAHLYHALMAGEEHVSKIDYLTTLAGYIQLLLTGQRVVGVGEASGMFPIDEKTGRYNKAMCMIFNGIAEVNDMPWWLEDILPAVLPAGKNAGYLTESGALLMDPDGDLMAGIPFCPPEGDAGTGMVATNSVQPGTGNVSAGTSIFGMVVMDKYPKTVYPELDIVTTPDGKPVAMVHCNNCSSEINAWMDIFHEFGRLYGVEISQGDLYTKLFRHSLTGDADCGGVIACNYTSGENITGVQNGRPMVIRGTEANMTLANFIRSEIYASMATLKTGMDILLKREGIRCSKLYAHGGLFRTKGVAQSYMAAAMNTPVTVLETAGEGGAWGMAILALYSVSGYDSLPKYLEEAIFNDQETVTVQPDPALVAGFDAYTDRFTKCLPIIREASATDLS